MSSKSSNKKVLGRGLSNLIPDALEGINPLHDELKYKDLSLDQITPNPNQPRKFFAEEELQELAKTLKSVGIIEPVIVRCLDKDNYQLIAGERRFRAAKIAGLSKIPAVIKQANDLEALEIGIIENVQREELNPIEEARAYEYWIETAKQKVDILAKKLGKNRSTVTNLIRILKLPPDILSLIEKKQLSIGQARPLLAIADRQKINKLGAQISKEAWSSRKVENEVAKITEVNPSLKKQKVSQDVNISKLETTLRMNLSARVEIKHKHNGSGVILISYGNLNDLERLLDKFKV